jgi:hypothetical protein
VPALHGLGSGARPELAVDRAGMRLDRVCGQEQLLADLSERERAAQQPKHRFLAFGQRRGDVPGGHGRLGGGALAVGGEGVADRLGGRAFEPVPGARPPVQLRHDIWLAAGEPAAEHLSEQVVIPEPLAMIVERHEEQVLALQQVDDVRCVCHARDGVAQLGGEAIKNGRPGQELADVMRLTAEDLLGQEVGDVAVAPGEGADEGAGGRVAAQGQGGHVDPGGPAFGPADQLGRVWLAEFDARGRAHERGRLSSREAQLPGADLGQVSHRPQPGQGQRRVGAGDDD